MKNKIKTFASITSIILMAFFCLAFSAIAQDEVIDKENLTITVQSGGTLNLYEGQLGRVTSADNEQMLGGITNFDTLGVDDIYLNGTDGYINFTTTEGSSGYGIRNNAGTVQYKNSGGSWGSIGGGTPGDEGWFADASDIFMYPSNRTSGNQYSLVIGNNATTTGASTDVLFIEGGATVSGALTIAGNSSLQQASSTNITASGILYVTGASNFTGAATLASTLGVTGNSTFVNASSTNLTVSGQTYTATTSVIDGDFVVDSTTFVVKEVSNKVGIGSSSPTDILTIEGTTAQLGLYYDGSNKTTFTVGSSGDLTVAAGGGDVSFDNDNITTTGNGSFGALTATGNITLDTNTLYLDATGNTVGIGTTTAMSYPLTVINGLMTFSSTSPYDVTAVLDSDAVDDGRLMLYANTSATVQLHANADSYLNSGATNGLGIGTTTAKVKLAVGDAMPGNVSGNEDAYIEGAFEVDGTAYFDGRVSASSTLMVTGAATMWSTLNVTGITTLVNASTTALTVSGTAYPATLVVSGNTTLTGTLGVTGITTVVNASSTVLSVSGTLYNTGATNLATTTISGGDLVVDTSTLVIDGDNNRVGVGTTTPVSTFEVYDSTGTTTLAIDAGTGGGCIKMKTVAGSWVYCTVAGTTFSCSATACE